MQALQVFLAKLFVIQKIKLEFQVGSITQSRQQQELELGVLGFS